MADYRTQYQKDGGTVYTPNKIYFNGNVVAKITFNGTLAWIKPDIFTIKKGRQLKRAYYSEGDFVIYDTEAFASQPKETAQHVLKRISPSELATAEEGYYFVDNI